MSKNTILFVGPTPTLSFVKQDLELLEEDFTVQACWRENHSSRSSLVSDLRRQLRRLKCGLLFVWFAEPYDVLSLVHLSRRFGIPCLVVVGGYEVTHIPALNYGGLGRLRDRLRVSVALRLATVVSPTSQLLAREVRSLGIARDLEVIPPGIDCEFFRPGSQGRQPLVVTVASVSKSTVGVKGLDIFAATSRLLPRVSFTILGPCADPASASRLEQCGGPNLTIPGKRLTSPELRSWYQTALVYAQLSARESFGIALAEAMACGCTPVVSEAGALPEVVGEAGTVVPYGDPTSAASAIERALQSGNANLARSRIETSFSKARRREKLKTLCRRLIRSS